MDDTLYIEEIRTRALGVMTERRLQVAAMARGTHYSPRSVSYYLSGQPDYQTIGIARSLAAAHPGLDLGLNCPHCGRRMT